MGKIIFGSGIHDNSIAIDKHLGPVSVILDYDDDINLYSNNKLSNIVSAEDVWIVNTIITPIPGTKRVIVYGDKVAVTKCPY